jgi:hypothetical protein
MLLVLDKGFKHCSNGNFSVLTDGFLPQVHLSVG